MRSSDSLPVKIIGVGALDSDCHDVACPQRPARLDMNRADEKAVARADEPDRSGRPRWRLVKRSNLHVAIASSPEGRTATAACAAAETREKMRHVAEQISEPRPDG